MQPVREAALQELRLRYRAAYTAHQACVRIVTEATMSGTGPSPAQIEQEAKALAELAKARARFLAAMANIGGEEQPPSSRPR